MDISSNFRMLINGELVTAARTFPVENPALAEPFAEVPDARPEDLDQAVAAARSAFSAWAGTPHEERCDLIGQWAARIEDHVDQLKQLLTAEQGKPHADAAKEVLGMVTWLKAAASHPIPTTINEDSETRYSETRHIPIGVVGAIAPWNYPLLLAAFKLGPALVTGNTVVMKPSPFTPLSTLKIGELAADLLPPGVLNIVSGGDDLGPWLTGHEGIDKVSFTGSTATGKRVMASAADTLKRLTLELGGNDPAIIMHDVDPEAIAGKLFWASFGNAGQICLASKRVYVHADIYDAVRNALIAFAQTVKVGDGAKPETQIGPVNNLLQYQRVLDLIEDTKLQGYAILTGSACDSSSGYFLPPMIVDNPPEPARIVQEEQFGPILPLLKFDTYDEAVARANASEYGLGATIWAGDEQAGWALAQRIEAGNVWVNEARPLSPMVAFSGHKQSGFGIENGIEGLLEYTLPKTMSRRKLV